MTFYTNFWEVFLFSNKSIHGITRMVIVNSFRCMVFNATFNNISVILCRSVLLVEETGIPGESTNLSQVTDKILSHNVFIDYTLPERN
jgi:hypothetical protein